MDIMIYKPHLPEQLIGNKRRINSGIKKGETVYTSFNAMKDDLESSDEIWYYCQCLIDADQLGDSSGKIEPKMVVDTELSNYSFYYRYMNDEDIRALYTRWVEKTYPGLDISRYGEGEYKAKSAELMYRAYVEGVRMSRENGFEDNKERYEKMSRRKE